ncbi:uncharacterized protein LOC144703134 [Wolffia australiana]
MAPPGEKLAGSYAVRRTPRLSIERFHRVSSDRTLDFSKSTADDSIDEVVNAKCDSCGMSEECTPAYVRRVRDRFYGKWICGLCSEAVKEEAEKKGVGLEEAVGAHMNVCARFNRFDRAFPVLHQAEKMKEMLQRSNTRSKSTSPRDKGNPKMTRCSSCMPAIIKTSNRS